MPSNRITKMARKHPGFSSCILLHGHQQLQCPQSTYSMQQNLQMQRSLIAAPKPGSLQNQANYGSQQFGQSFVGCPPAYHATSQAPPTSRPGKKTNVDDRLARHSRLDALFDSRIRGAVSKRLTGAGRTPRKIPNAGNPTNGAVCPLPPTRHTSQDDQRRAPLPNFQNVLPGTQSQPPALPSLEKTTNPLNPGVRTNGTTNDNPPPSHIVSVPEWVEDLDLSARLYIAHKLITPYSEFEEKFVASLKKSRWVKDTTLVPTNGGIIGRTRVNNEKSTAIVEIDLTDEPVKRMPVIKPKSLDEMLARHVPDTVQQSQSKLSNQHLQVASDTTTNSSTNTLDIPACLNREKSTDIIPTKVLPEISAIPLSLNKILPAPNYFSSLTLYSDIGVCNIKAVQNDSMKERQCQQDCIVNTPPSAIPSSVIYELPNLDAVNEPSFSAKPVQANKTKHKNNDSMKERQCRQDCIVTTPPSAVPSSMINDLPNLDGIIEPSIPTKPAQTDKTKHNNNKRKKIAKEKSVVKKKKIKHLIFPEREYGYIFNKHLYYKKLHEDKRVIAQNGLFETKNKSDIKKRKRKRVISTNEPPLKMTIRKEQTPTDEVQNVYESSEIIANNSESQKMCSSTDLIKTTMNEPAPENYVIIHNTSLSLLNQKTCIISTDDTDKESSVSISNSAINLNNQPTSLSGTISPESNIIIDVDQEIPPLNNNKTNVMDKHHSLHLGTAVKKTTNATDANKTTDATDANKTTNATDANKTTDATDAKKTINATDSKKTADAKKTTNATDAKKKTDAKKTTNTTDAKKTTGATDAMKTTNATDAHCESIKRSPPSNSQGNKKSKGNLNRNSSNGKTSKLYEIDIFEAQTSSINRNKYSLKYFIKKYKLKPCSVVLSRLPSSPLDNNVIDKTYTGVGLERMSSNSTSNIGVSTLDVNKTACSRNSTSLSPAFEVHRNNGNKVCNSKNKENYSLEVTECSKTTNTSEIRELTSSSETKLKEISLVSKENCSERKEHISKCFEMCEEVNSEKKEQNPSTKMSLAGDNFRSKNENTIDIIKQEITGNFARRTERNSFNEIVTNIESSKKKGEVHNSINKKISDPSEKNQRTHNSNNRRTLSDSSLIKARRSSADKKSRVNNFEIKERKSGSNWDSAVSEIKGPKSVADKKPLVDPCSRKDRRPSSGSLEGSTEIRGRKSDEKKQRLGLTDKKDKIASVSSHGHKDDSGEKNQQKHNTDKKEPVQVVAKDIDQQVTVQERKNKRRDGSERPASVTVVDSPGMSQRKSCSDKIINNVDCGDKTKNRSNYETKDKGYGDTNITKAVIEEKCGSNTDEGTKRLLQPVPLPFDHVKLGSEAKENSHNGSSSHPDKLSRLIDQVLDENQCKRTVFYDNPSRSHATPLSPTGVENGSKEGDKRNNPDWSEDTSNKHSLPISQTPDNRQTDSGVGRITKVVSLSSSQKITYIDLINRRKSTDLMNAHSSSVTVDNTKPTARDNVAAASDKQEGKKSIPVPDPRLWNLTYCGLDTEPLKNPRIGDPSSNLYREDSDTCHDSRRTTSKEPAATVTHPFLRQPVDLKTVSYASFTCSKCQQVFPILKDWSNHPSCK